MGRMAGEITQGCQQARGRPALHSQCSSEAAWATPRPDLLMFPCCLVRFWQVFLPEPALLQQEPDGSILSISDGHELRVRLGMRKHREWVEWRGDCQPCGDTHPLDKVEGLDPTW